MLGEVTATAVRLTEALRFDNVPVRVAGTLHWDILRIYRGVLEGLRAAGRVSGRLDTVGIDGWGVDYGLLDADGRLVGNPVHYRDARTAEVAPQVLAQLSAVELYRRTGLQYLPFNTLYQLAATSRWSLAAPAPC